MVRLPGGPFPTSHPLSAGILAQASVRRSEIKGPLSNITFWWSLGSDIRFAEPADRWVANLKSAPLAPLRDLGEGHLTLSVRSWIAVAAWAVAAWAWV